MIDTNEFEICKRRGHDGPIASHWKQCKWCGAWLRKVEVIQIVVEVQEHEPPDRDSTRCDNRPKSASRFSPLPHLVTQLQSPGEGGLPPIMLTLSTQNRLQRDIYIALKRHGVENPLNAGEWTCIASLTVLARQVAPVARQTLLNSLNVMAARHELRPIAGRGNQSGGWTVLPLNEVSGLREVDPGIGKDAEGMIYYIGRARRLLNQGEITAWNLNSRKAAIR